MSHTNTETLNPVNIRKTGSSAALLKSHNRGVKKTTEQARIIGQRLRLAIQTTGRSQKFIAEQFGVSPSKLNNWLAGTHYPNQEFVTAFCERYGITTDWIYRGVVSGMPKDLADKLWHGGGSRSDKKLKSFFSV
jgi:ribosome-binding protein aMBF1 (putative translation factor)